MAKQIIFDSEAWRKIESGVTKVANAVKRTLGPRGRNVVLEKKWGSPTITNDGVTIAKEIELEDPFENMGAQLVKEVASKTNDIAGDGTTTATVLAEAIFKEGLKNVVAGANPMDIKRGIEKAVEIIREQIKKQAQPVSTKAAIANVATISANNDAFIGNIIADALDKVGKDGVVTVEESKGMETTLDFVEGMQFDKGYISPYMVTDRDTMSCKFEDPYLLITDRKISAIKDLLPILEKIVQSGRPLVIIAEDIEGEALATLVVNTIRGTIKVVGVKAPGFGDRRKAMLEDLAVLTEAEVISEEKGMTLEGIELEQLGTAKSVKVEKENTTVVEGKGSKKKVAERIAQINAEIEKSDSDYDKEKLKERLAKLSKGVAVIKVGAATETELKEKKLRVEDAQAATKAAVEEGIVAGGGVALLNCKKAVEKEALKLEGDEKVGALIVARALSAPLRQIVDNAGKEGSVIVEAILSGKEKGYNAQILEYQDLMAAGVVDPAKVTRSALQNAASIAAMLLTTEVLIADKPEPKQPASVGAPGMGGMGGMGGDMM